MPRAGVRAQPAIVAYLMSRQVAGPAVVATLMDLARRGYFQIRETVETRRGIASGAMVVNVLFGVGIALAGLAFCVTSLSTSESSMVASVSSSMSSATGAGGGASGGGGAG